MQLAELDRSLEDAETHQLQDPQHGVDVPSFSRRETVGRHTNLAGHDRFELVVGCFEEGQELPDEHTNVGFVDEGEAEIERTTTDADVGIAETFENRISMALNRVGLYRNNLDEGIEGDVPDVVVPITQKLAEDIHSQNTKSRIGLDVEDGEYGLVEDGVPHVLRRIGIGGNLGEDVIYLFAGLRIATSEYPQQLKNLDLQKRIGDSRDIVLGCVARAGQALQGLDQNNGHRSEGLDNILQSSFGFFRLTETGDQGEATQKNAMIPIRQEQLRLLQKVLLQIRYLPTDSHGAQGGFTADVGIGGGEESLNFGE